MAVLKGSELIPFPLAFLPAHLCEFFTAFVLAHPTTAEVLAAQRKVAEVFGEL